MMDLTKRNSAKKAVNFGFIGIGQGGGRIVDAFARLKVTQDKSLISAYPVIAINTNIHDLAQLKNIKDKVALKGFDVGAGRNPETGLAAYSQNREYIKSEIIRRFKDVDMLFVIAGLGGGTGTGILIELALDLDELGFPVSFIVTLPRDKEQLIDRKNACKALDSLNVIIDHKSVIWLDNQSIYDFYTSHNLNEADWLMHSNVQLADIIHELNLLSSGVTPFGATNFDGAEFKKFLFTPGGFTLGKNVIKFETIAEAQASLIQGFRDVCETGLFTQKLNLHEAKNVSLCLATSSSLAPKIFTKTTLDSLQEEMDSYFPNTDFKTIAPYEDTTGTSLAKECYLYLVVSGLPYPKERVQNMINSIAEQEKKLIKNLSADIDFSQVASTAEPPAKQNLRDLIANKNQSESKQSIGGLRSKLLKN